MSWSADYVGPNPVVDQLITETGAILLGHRTFGGEDPFNGQPGEGEALVTFIGEIDTARAGHITTLWYRVAPRPGSRTGVTFEYDWRGWPYRRFAGDHYGHRVGGKASVTGAVQRRRAYRGLDSPSPVRRPSLVGTLAASSQTFATGPTAPRGVDGRRHCGSGGR